MAQDIRAWLEDLGLERYSRLFAENEIDLDVLPKLTSKDLQELGLPLGPRRKILSAAAALSASSERPTTADRNQQAEAERRHLTVTFFDLVGSTALAERLDPGSYAL